MLTTRLAAPCQSGNEHSADRERDYKRLWFLNNLYIQSWISSDTLTYDGLLWADDFIQQNATDGNLYTKKEMLQIFGQKRFEEIEYFFADMTRIQFINDSAAMIFSRPVYQGKHQGTESVSAYNDLYVKRDGNWVCVAANICLTRPEGTAFPLISRIPTRLQMGMPGIGKQEDRDILSALNQSLKKLQEESDVQAANFLLHEEFVWLNRYGRMADRKAVLQKLVETGSGKKMKYSLENLDIRFVSEDLALVRGIIRYHLPLKKISAIQYTDIYVKRKESWSCISANDTPVCN